MPKKKHTSIGSIPKRKKDETGRPISLRSFWKSILHLESRSRPRFTYNGEAKCPKRNALPLEGYQNEKKKTKKIKKNR